MTREGLGKILLLTGFFLLLASMTVVIWQIFHPMAAVIFVLILAGALLQAF